MQTGVNPKAPTKTFMKFSYFNEVSFFTFRRVCPDNQGHPCLNSPIKANGQI